MRDLDCRYSLNNFGTNFLRSTLLVIIIDSSFSSTNRMTGHHNKKSFLYLRWFAIADLERFIALITILSCCWRLWSTSDGTRFWSASPWAHRQLSNRRRKTRLSEPRKETEDLVRRKTRLSEPRKETEEFVRAKISTYQLHRGSRASLFCLTRQEARSHLASD